MKIDTDQHKLLAEFKNNKRIHWLGLIIVILLSTSGIRAISEKNSDLITQIDNQYRLLQRLGAATKIQLSAEDAELKVQEANTMLSKLPTAPSVAVAEAESLTRIEQITSDVRKNRSSLVATESILTAEETLWQVRVEFQGELDQQYFSSFLQKIDGSDPTIRLVSMRYRPNRRGTLYIVIDFMFRKGER